MEFQKEPGRIFALGEDGKLLAEITFPTGEDGVADIDHTFVDESLRGQGVASQLVRAAAAELRGKIAQELTRRVAERPGDGHLRRQMLRVYQADIKTVDAFCAGLLRENVHLLPPVEEHSLTPDFRVLDEQEAALLRRRVLDRVLEDF